MTVFECNFTVPTQEDLANGYFLADHLEMLSLEELSFFLESVVGDRAGIVRKWAELDEEVVVVEDESGIEVRTPLGQWLRVPCK
ncbi:hypothetical protein [Corynebacterium kalinowskii]|uniref:hypothetical protein n=1 Tax=Corynebacterium kalinowskii TaxID=2675216 RepID=UPI0012E126DC|nr:hypothetical protein [Corynebacterium kalinowskii]